MSNYNTFHRKNVNIQKRLIDSKNFTYQSLISVFSKYFESQKRVLDLGCGVGTVDFYLASKGINVTGVDVSSRAIRLAKLSKTEMNINNINFYCSSIEQFHDREKYDYVILSEVIEHLEDPARVMSHIKEMMLEKSLLVVSTPLSSAPLYRWGMLREFDKQVGHLRRYSTDELIEFVKTNGFEIVEFFKTEGLLRNLLYTNKFMGFFLRFIRWPISIIFNLLDNLMVRLFGPSNIYLVCRKK